MKSHIKNSLEYEKIKDYYGDGVAKRSQVSFMNHIHEGFDFLMDINASDEAMLAFLIHPIAQSYEDVSWSRVSKLAEEYTYFANKFLCVPETDHIRDFVSLDHHLHEDIDYRISDDCIDMLIADKRQNRKDFILYHGTSHPRKKQLYSYFNIWLEYLDLIKTNKAS